MLPPAWSAGHCPPVFAMLLLGAAAAPSFAPSVPSLLDERSHSEGAGLCDPSVKQLSGYVR